MFVLDIFSTIAVYSFIYIFLFIYLFILMHQAQSTWWQWCSHVSPELWGLSMELSSGHLSGTKNFVMASWFLWNLWTPLWLFISDEFLLLWGTLVFSSKYQL